MSDLTHLPLVVVVFTFALVWTSSWIGAAVFAALAENAREDLNVRVSATLTLLGLIIGFSFSMAASRYGLCGSLEEREDNAIGTKYLRAELLPASDAAKARLEDYLEQRSNAVPSSCA
jgi:hypothetical protein